MINRSFEKVFESIPITPRKLGLFFFHVAKIEKRNEPNLPEVALKVKGTNVFVYKYSHLEWLYLDSTP